MNDMDLPGYDSITLRDFFAGVALLALMGTPEWVDAFKKKYGGTAQDHFADVAYDVADSMMKARRVIRPDSP